MIDDIAPSDTGNLTDPDIATPGATHSPFDIDHTGDHASDRAHDTPPTTTPPAVLSIAGSDSSGGAGIQADIKTMLANGVYGMAVIAALTAQNTTGVRAIEAVTPEILADQIDAVFTDIRPAAVKIGMLANAALIEVAADKLEEYQTDNVVLDPVMVSTSGARLLDENAVSALTARLFPLALVVTPNLREAEVLIRPPRDSLQSHAAMERAAREISVRFGCNALVKGGHNTTDADDLLWFRGEALWMPGPHIDTENTHGTGCTLSSAIASNLARGEALPSAVSHAKSYLTGALQAGLDLGAGHGPLDHAWMWHTGN